MTEAERERLAIGREDLAYHQMRVLLLVNAVSSSGGHAGKLDGLTKLAKLDFLVRYPGLADRVLSNLAELPASLTEDARGIESEAPMVRYKYGPWDDRYYAVIGALVGRGLLRYVKGRRGSVALKPTASGHKLAEAASSTDSWREIAQQCYRIADGSRGLSGSALKDLIYERLPEVVDRPHREVIR